MKNKRFYKKFLHRLFMYGMYALSGLVHLKTGELAMPAIRKHTQNVVIDTLSFFCMLILLVTGAIMYISLPPGSHGESLLGLTRHEWGDIHFWTAIVFVMMILIHLVLHASWIKASFLPSDVVKRRKALVLITICIYGFFVLAIGMIFSPLD